MRCPPAAAAASASSAPAAAREEGITEAFQRIDMNGDGVLSRAEVLKGLQQADKEVRLLLGLPRFLSTPDEREAFDAIFDDLDSDQTDSVDVGEFLRVFGRPANESQAGRMQLATHLVAMGYAGVAPHVDISSSA